MLWISSIITRLLEKYSVFYGSHEQRNGQVEINMGVSKDCSGQEF